MNQAIIPTRRGEFWAGFKATVPLVVGAIPFGIIFGAFGVASGLSMAGTMGMSLFVFAGSAQFIAAGLVADHAGVAVIVFTTFIVNLRHALYSASLAPYVKRLPQKWLLPLGFWLTDESFVVVITRYTQPDESPYKHWYYLGSAVFMYTNWQLCTLLGIIAGQTIPDMRDWGLDFAITVTFIGMLIVLIKSRPLLLSAVVAGISAVLLNGLEHKLGLILATLLGVAAGVIAEALLPQDAKRTSPQPESAGGGPHE
ncbi:MAG: AzlC family ABC transporter permease [Anaerolineaceae bacterium]|nr:AzlC family ABC transporter permease [Anaerolineaceae bacterium]